MCDAETKRFFKWGYVLQGALLAAVIALGSLVVQIRDHSIAADIVHDQIPAGFFTQRRWGLDDERLEQKRVAAELRLISERINLIASQQEAHLHEAEIWKDMIRDLVEHSKTTHPTYP